MEQDQTFPMDMSPQVLIKTESREENDAGDFQADLNDHEMLNMGRLPANVYRTTQVHIRELEFQCNQLVEQVVENKREISGLEEALDGSFSRISTLKAQIVDLEKRHEDAISTLFRLRPQRQECPESEIKQGYDMLKHSIAAWVEENCEDFLDNDNLGFKLIGEKDYSIDAPRRRHELILKAFHSSSNSFRGVKDQVLIATIMLFVHGRILAQTYPVWLPNDYKVFLCDIEDSMKNMEPKKDLSTHMTWRSDTMVSIFNSDTHSKAQAATARNLTRRLFAIVRKTLATNASTEDIMSSILLQVIEPSFALARKFQCASSSWELEYSLYWNSTPGVHAHYMPGFFDSVKDLHCVNASAHRKVLKPDTDLATQEQMNRLVYVLDVFPGLYCSRLDIDKFLPGKAISQPVLLVELGAPRVRG